MRTLILSAILFTIPAVAQSTAGVPRVMYDDIANEYWPLGDSMAFPGGTGPGGSGDTVATNAGTNNNRSGLGDGTNPGAGGLHADNGGTYNPGGLRQGR